MANNINMLLDKASCLLAMVIFLYLKKEEKRKKQNLLQKSLTF